MGFAKEQLDRYVMKVIRKLAAVEREEIALIAVNKKKKGKPSQELKDQLNALFERGNDSIIDLLQTNYAFGVLGGNPFESEEDPADNLRILGEHLLGVYALDRMLAEMDHVDPEEDVFYAGTYLVHRATVSAVNEEDQDEADDLDEEEVKEIDWEEPHEKSRKSSGIVRLFDDDIQN